MYRVDDMGATEATGGLYHIPTELRGVTRTVFVGALLLFLVNITLGFLNVFTSGDIPFWQLITHFHAATLGWITLSVVGIILWAFTTTPSRRLSQYAWAAVLVIAGYIASFGVGFYVMGDAYALLPVFGSLALLVIWTAAGIAITRVRDQDPVTTVHLMLMGGISVAALGAVMGVLAGVEHVVGPFDLPENASIIGAHGSTMDIYALMIGAALIEWVVTGEDTTTYSRWGLLQAGGWVLAGVSIFLSNALGIGPLNPIAAIVGLIGMPVLFFARIGWRAVAATPIDSGVGAWTFFSTIWMYVYLVGLLGAVFGVIPEGADWAFTIVFHAFYVGLLTNALFAVYSIRTRDAPDFHAFAEPVAWWTLNLGVVVFGATEYFMESRHGAMIMGVGVLLAVATMLYRFRAESGDDGFGGGFQAAPVD